MKIFNNILPAILNNASSSNTLTFRLRAPEIHIICTSIYIHMNISTLHNTYINLTSSVLNWITEMNINRSNPHIKIRNFPLSKPTLDSKITYMRTRRYNCIQYTQISTQLDKNTATTNKFASDQWKKIIIMKKKNSTDLKSF